MRLDKIVRAFSPLRYGVEFVFGRLINLKGRVTQLKETSSCVIVCNGPSLNRCDLDKIQVDSIGMNKIHLIYPKFEWRPSFIVAQNGLVLSQIKSLVRQVTDIYVLPVKGLLLGMGYRKNLVYLPPIKRLNYMSNILGIYEGSTVTATALNIAMSMGYKRIGIIGMDHNFVVNGDPNEIKKFQGEDVNHFHPDYFKGKFWGNPDLVKSEEEYNFALTRSKALGVEIIDFTVGGNCNVFQKGAIDDMYSWVDHCHK